MHTYRVRAFVQALDSRDPERIAAQFHPTGRLLINNTSYIGRQEIIEYYRHRFISFGSARHVISRQSTPLRGRTSQWAWIAVLPDAVGVTLSSGIYDVRLRLTGQIRELRVCIESMLQLPTLEHVEESLR